MYHFDDLNYGKLANCGKKTEIIAQTHEVVEVRGENSGLALMHPVEYIREVIDMFYGKPAETE